MFVTWTLGCNEDHVLALAVCLFLLIAHYPSPTFHLHVLFPPFLLLSSKAELARVANANKSILMFLTALSSSLSLSQACSCNSVMFRGALVIHAVQDIHRALFLPLSRSSNEVSVYAAERSRLELRWWGRRGASVLLYADPRRGCWGRPGSIPSAPEVEI